jgi:hypothetical protein
MGARALICSFSDDRTHRTLVLGAAVDVAHPDTAAVTSLLEAQLEAIEALARGRYRDYGRAGRRPPVSRR